MTFKKLSFMLDQFDMIVESGPGSNDDKGINKPWYLSLSKSMIKKSLNLLLPEAMIKKFKLIILYTKFIKFIKKLKLIKKINLL